MLKLNDLIIQYNDLICENGPFLLKDNSNDGCFIVYYLSLRINDICIIINNPPIAYDDDGIELDNFNNNTNIDKKNVLDLIKSSKVYKLMRKKIEMFFDNSKELYNKEYISQFDTFEDFLDNKIVSAVMSMEYDNDIELYS